MCGGCYQRGYVADSGFAQKGLGIISMTTLPKCPDASRPDNVTALMRVFLKSKLCIECGSSNQCDLLKTQSIQIRNTCFKAHAKPAEKYDPESVTCKLCANKEECFLKRHNYQ